jgi:hypothetical protein
MAVSSVSKLGRSPRSATTGSRKVAQPSRFFGTSLSFHRPEHTVVLRVEADRPARQARLAQRRALPASSVPLGSVDSHQSIRPETLRLLATDGFLLDGLMHMAQVGTAPGMGVAVTVVPHPGNARLLVGGLALGAVVGASFGVPLAVAVLVSSHRPRLPARYDDHAVGAT